MGSRTAAGLSFPAASHPAVGNALWRYPGRAFGICGAERCIFRSKPWCLHSALARGRIGWFGGMAWRIGSSNGICLAHTHSSASGFGAVGAVSPVTLCRRMVGLRAYGLCLGTRSEQHCRILAALVDTRVARLVLHPCPALCHTTFGSGLGAGSGGHPSALERARSHHFRLIFGGIINVDPFTR